MEKERKKSEKEKKFLQKKAKQQAQAQATATSQPKPKAKPVKNATKNETYEPAAIEAGRYDWWESNGFFKPQFSPDGEDRETFVIALPPPNVTGSLHMGHALTIALQDTMVRHARMQGKIALWIPGCDHAGISTQIVVEKMLWRTEAKTRHDYGREALIEKIWTWKDHYHQNITNQLRRLGGSMDWSREAFTMDSNFSAAVMETFIRLHDEGIIYRENRIVDWCTVLQTTLSTLEIDTEEISGRTELPVPGYDQPVTFGVLTYFKYPIAESEEFIEIATTRPETMLGDTGIAVHPQDPRYSGLVGKRAKHPFISELYLPIVAAEDVNPAFGTGAVKITPAHDKVDFIRGKAHNLKSINLMNPDGTFNANAGPFQGMKRYDVRKAVVVELKKKGLWVKEEDNKMSLPRCQKTGDVLEPILKSQWWMKMEQLAQPALEAVKSGRIKIRPESAQTSYYRWLENIQDWCLSRQLWWGHRAPAYFIDIAGVSDDADETYWVSASSESAAREKAEKRFPGTTFNLVQDEDVLDTWFSSGQWPFAILGWPLQNGQDFERFYPTSVLETGWDILFFWVARMIMLGLKMTDQVPFTEVYCHGLIRDANHVKMSKSKGNGIDPVDVIEGVSLQQLQEKLRIGNLDPKELEKASLYQKQQFPQGIPTCGTDALRYALVDSTTGGDVIVQPTKIESNRKDCNKMLQATNFVLGRLGDDFRPSSSSQSVVRSLAEKWILHKFNICARTMHATIENRQFSEATQAWHKYWKEQLCDTFIENSKFLISEEQTSVKQTLYTALEGGLLLIHPVMPYITEYLWQKLPRRLGDNTTSIMVARYPVFDESFDNPKAAEDYELVMAIAQGMRSLLSHYQLKEPGELYIQTKSHKAFAIASREVTSIKSLGGKFVGEIETLPPDAANSPSPRGCAGLAVSSDAAVYLRVVGRVDLLSEKEKAQGQLEAVQLRVSQMEEKMAAPGWIKAKAEAKEREEQKLQAAQSEAATFVQVIEELDRLILDA